MGKIRVYELARELKKSNREVVDRLSRLKISVKSTLSALTEEQADEVRVSFGLKPKAKKPKKAPEKPPKKAAKPAKAKPATKAAKAAKKAPEKPPKKAAKPAKAKPATKAAKAAKKVPEKPPKNATTAAAAEKKAPPRKMEAAKSAREPLVPPTKAQRPPLTRAPEAGATTAQPPATAEKKVYRYVPRGRKAPLRFHHGTSQTIARKQLRVAPDITVKEFARKAGLTPAEVIKKLISLGELVTANQSIGEEALGLLSEELEFEIKVKDTQKIEEELEKITDEDSDLVERPPVVTVMGHVDHGKTRLLDAIRKTDVVGSEAGGITQHIGAYQVTYQGKKITFIDTPGHESFTAMRMRGASITDIAVLVVAADDGVMPQTVEALNHARNAGVPIIVAVNKIDKPDADPSKVRQQLVEKGLVPEEWGGDSLFVDISAREGTNLDSLLEAILLVADLLELKANPNAPGSGVVLEAKLEKGRGPTVTLLFQRGTGRIGDAIIAGSVSGKIRAMFDEWGRNVEEAKPSQPVEVIGLSGVPMAGDKFWVVQEEKLARQVAERQLDNLRVKERGGTRKISLEDLEEKLKGEKKQLVLIVKADTQGSLEAILQSLQKLNREEAEVGVIHSGVGGISETDVMLASAGNGLIVGFNVKPDSKARRAAEEQNVELRTYNVIYELTEDMEKALRGMLPPTYEEEIVGVAEVRQTFRIPQVGVVAGVYVTEGEVGRNSRIRVVRDGTVVYESKVSSLRRFKDDVKSVSQGFECGVGIEGFQDLKVGDVLEFIDLREIPA